MGPTSFDVALESLLTAWEPRIGRPTCGPGCSRCCERSTIFISSAEALRMLEFVGENSDLRAEWQRRVVRLRENHADGPVEAQNALINLGPCIFLNEASTCEVYQARPDACRACHVWHTAEHCRALRARGLRHVYARRVQRLARRPHSPTHAGGAQPRSPTVLGTTPTDDRDSR